MATPNDRFKAGDNTNDLLRKILEVLWDIRDRIEIMPIDNPSVVAVTATAQVATIDRSGTITTNNVSQQIAAANPTRQLFIFQNNSGSDLWVNFGAAATKSQPSILISAKGSITFEGPTIPTDTVNVIGNAGQQFTAKEG